ncbi:hypothetical protein IT781_08640 [Methylobacter sp. BlB1]|jgi:putative transposase|nr:hypothetical protein [Methylobacter sp. BlB1]
MKRWCITERLRFAIPIRGGQFTREAFTSKLKTHQIQISMDDKASRIDNVFVERLWRCLKPEKIYLKMHETPQ